MKSWLLILSLGALLSGCASSSLISDGGYQESMSKMKQQDIYAALRTFPAKEEKGFITTIEKNWLKIWTHDASPEELVPLGNQIDSRKFLSLSKEAQYFFFNETEDGYIPPEHEVIALHIITAMAFIQKKNLAEAEVEARKAAFYLQSYYPENHPHFDDEYLRAWLAGVWIALDKKEEAQVDLRKIYQMNGDKYYLNLAERLGDPKTANSKWKITFEGFGPELKWRDSDPIPDFYIPKLLSSTTGQKENILYSNNWYERLRFRNLLIRDELSKSKYMTQYYGVKLNSGIEKGTGMVASAALKITGVVVSAVIIGGVLYVAIQSGGSGGEGFAYLMALGFGAGVYLWDKGTQISNSFSDSAKKYESESIDSMKTFRFVRFLPSRMKIEEVSDNEVVELNFKSPNEKMIFNWKP